MKSLKSLIVITAFALCASCNNNNNDTGDMDSVSVSTDPSMGGSTDTGITSSDSTDIRMPMMADSSGNAGAATGQGDDSSHHK